MNTNKVDQFIESVNSEKQLLNKIGFENYKSFLSYNSEKKQGPPQLISMESDIINFDKSDIHYIPNDPNIPNESRKNVQKKSKSNLEFPLSISNIFFYIFKSAME